MEELYDFTIISNEVLDKYLSDVKPEYIKVLLFYLWKGIKENYTVSETSNEIDLDEHVVEMALKYWIKKKVIKKDYLIYDKVNTIEVTDNLVDFKSKKKELIDKSKNDYLEIENNLLFVAEKLLGQTLSERQENVIVKCYNDYGFNEGLIHYLLEYCSNSTKATARYMDAVASSWYEAGIKTVDAAKKFTEGFTKQATKTVKKNIKSNVIDRKEYDRKLMESMFSGK